MTRALAARGKNLRNAMEKAAEKPSPIKIGTGIIIVKDGSVLLAQRAKSKTLAPGCWGTTGGHVELNETPAQAAIREAKEELGIDAGNLKFLACFDEQWRDGAHYVDVIFSGEILSGEPKINEPDKIDAIGWFPLSELPSPMFAPVEMALRNWKSNNHYLEFKE